RPILRPDLAGAQVLTRKLNFNPGCASIPTPAMKTTFASICVALMVLAATRTASFAQDDNTTYEAPDATSVVYQAPVTYYASVVYQAPVVYYAPVYYVSAAAATASCAAQTPCYRSEPASTV